MPSILWLSFIVPATHPCFSDHHHVNSASTQTMHDLSFRRARLRSSGHYSLPRSARRLASFDGELLRSAFKNASPSLISRSISA